MKFDTIKLEPSPDGNMLDDTVPSEARLAMLHAFASGKFNSPVSMDPEERRRYEEAYSEIARAVQPLIDASRRAEHIPANELCRIVDGPTVSFGIGNVSGK